MKDCSRKNKRNAKSTNRDFKKENRFYMMISVLMKTVIFTDELLCIYLLDK